MVSHDRHMIETTADRLVLVDGGTAREYAGSLDDYIALVLAKDAADSGKAGAKADRKEARRHAAAEREESRKLKKQAQAAEAELARLAEQRSAIDRAMFDPKTADAALAKLTMGELMKQRSAIKSGSREGAVIGGGAGRGEGDSAGGVCRSSGSALAGAAVSGPSPGLHAGPSVRAMVAGGGGALIYGCHRTMKRMKLSAALAATLFAGAAAIGADDEIPGYQWVHDSEMSSMCTAYLNGPGPGAIGPISGSVETGNRGEIFYVFDARSDDWPIAEEQEGYPIEIGFDNSGDRTPIEMAWGWTPGGIQFELDEAVRQRLAGARSVEFYRNGRRLGSAPTNGLGAALESIRRCAENDALNTGDAIDAGGMTMENALDTMVADMNASADPEFQ
jgi:hypothetical protein